MSRCHVKASNALGESVSSNLLVFTPGKKAPESDDDDLSHPDDDPDSSHDRSGTALHSHKSRARTKIL
jgi:hypothetical protein